MDFALELTVFPSMVHRTIYSAARGIYPLNKSLEVLEDASLQASAAAYHGFVMALLSDMYDHPEAYHLPVLMLENFCAGKTVNAVKQKYPSKMKAILAQTRNSVHGYVALISHLGRLGKRTGDTLIVSPEDMQAIAKQVNTSTSPIALDKRLDALRRVGLECEGNVLTAVQYPGMLPALCALAAKAMPMSGFNFFAFSTVDFRCLRPKYKPAPVDYFRPLISAQRAQAEALHAFAVANGLTPTINTYWKVDYKYKGAQVMCIGSEGDHERLLDVRIIGTYHWNDSALINSRLAQQPQEFQRQVLRHIWRCDACATTHLGMFVWVLGKKQRVCGGGVIGFRFRNPNTEDIAVMKQLICMRCQIIQELGNNDHPER